MRLCCRGVMHWTNFSSGSVGRRCSRAPVAVVTSVSRGTGSSCRHSLVEQRRGITRLYTSFYPGNLYPNQLVRHPQRRPVQSANSLRAAQAQQNVDGPKHRSMPDTAVGPATHSVLPAVSWSSAESTDLMHANTIRDVPAPSMQPPHGQRSYVPLGEVAKLELQADYLTEGGMHQEALEYYGVVAKAYACAYPEGHEHRVGILSKLSGAFRRTGRLESSKAVAADALAILDASPVASLELLVEVLLELGLTKEALHEADAGDTYEDAVTVMQSFHDFGESHRMLRLLPRLSRRLRLNYEEKFRYFSPFDMDRTFALVDQCLERASALYKRTGAAEKRIRVLQTRKQLIDKKFFNLRDFAGRIHTMRGHWMRRASVLTNAPTPDELLRYSPTIHQVYRDFKYELNTPIGRESEVQQGVNRTVLDMGNPYRRRGHKERQRMREADYNYAKYTCSKEFGV